MSRRCVESSSAARIILRKVEDMAAYAHHCSEQFPKAHRFTLGERLQDTIIEIIALIVACNRRYHKETTLQELDIKLDTLRSPVRVARSLEILAFGQYEHWSRQNDEIGRLLGGWIRATGQGPPPRAEVAAEPEEALSKGAAVGHLRPGALRRPRAAVSRWLRLAFLAGGG